MYKLYEITSLATGCSYIWNEPKCRRIYGNSGPNRWAAIKRDESSVIKAVHVGWQMKGGVMMYTDHIIGAKEAARRNKPGIVYGSTLVV